MVVRSRDSPLRAVEAVLWCEEACFGYASTAAMTTEPTVFAWAMCPSD